MERYTQEERIKELKSLFPIQFNEDISLYMLNEDIEIVQNKNGYKYIFNIVDNEGYKYRQDYHHVISSRSYAKRPCRFFCNNPYTYDNINNFCRLNDLDLCIDGKGLPLSGYAREKLNFLTSNKDSVVVSWNEIQRSPFRYKNNKKQVMAEKFEETHMTKDKAIPIILIKQKEVGRPLIQSDFLGTKTTDTTIGIRIIRRIWGTFTEMLKDLELPVHDTYYKPYDKYYKPHDEIMNSIKTVCDKVKESGRTTVTYSDFNNFVNISEISTVRRHCNLDGLELNDVIKSYGCKLQRAGNGMNHRFEDGEKVVSKYEYDFSKFLRDNGLIYNKDYFRNIYYKKLDSEYKGNINCDYYITFNGMNTYIELAGILGNKEHQEAYKNNTVIKSKSKEEYRNKLNLKREIFERNNLRYYILLKDDMNENNYKIIFDKYLKEVA